MKTQALSRNAQAVVASYEACNRRDVDASISLVADDYRFIDHAQRTSANGRDAIRAWVESMFAASSDIRCEPHVLVDLGEVVVIKVVSEGTHDGHFAGLPPTGQRVRTTQCEVHRFDAAGRLVESEMFYDLYGMLADMGAVPPLDGEHQG